MPETKERKSHVWEKHPDNWYVEPSWCVERLFDAVSFFGTIHDPCCGLGTIPLVARRAGFKTTASDIVDRALTKPVGVGLPTKFSITRYQDDHRMHDNIVCNPPFDDINETPLPFVQWALAHTRDKVALLVPFKWFAGDKRSRVLETLPLGRVLMLTPRPSMPPGPALLDMWSRGEEPKGGREDFAWAIFGDNYDTEGDQQPPEFGWLHRDD